MRRKILLAEDDAPTRAVITDMLKIEGFEVVGVSNGFAAIGAVDTFTPDIAILDVMMPGKDGIAVLEHLRGDERTRTMPVIILTARADSDTTWAGWRAGCDYYMNKPFEPDDLIATVIRLLGDRVAG